MVQAGIEANRGNLETMTVRSSSFPAVNWNDTHIATTVAGKSYSG